MTADEAASIRSASSSKVSRPSAAAARKRSTQASRSASEARTSMNLALYGRWRSLSGEKR